MTFNFFGYSARSLSHILISDKLFLSCNCCSMFHLVTIFILLRFIFNHSVVLSSLNRCSSCDLSYLSLAINIIVGVPEVGNSLFAISVIGSLAYNYFAVNSK